MSVKDDIAKAKKLGELNSKISALNTQIKETTDDFVQKQSLLTTKIDDEIKMLFKDRLSHPEIKVEIKGDEITGRGVNLSYSLKISDEARIISRVLDGNEEKYKFRYVFSSHIPNQPGWTPRGTETEEELKNLQIASLEKYLELCNKARDKLVSEGIQIESFKMDRGELTFTSMSKKELESEDEKKYSKTNIQRLLRLIGLEEVTP